MCGAGTSSLAGKGGAGGSDGVAHAGNVAISKNKATARIFFPIKDIISFVYHFHSVCGRLAL